MKKLLISALTDGTNRDIDFTKLLGSAAFIVFLFLTAYYYGWAHHDWDPMTWTGAVAVLLGAVGGVSKVKDFSGGSEQTTITKEPNKITETKESQ